MTTVAMVEAMVDAMANGDFDDDDDDQDQDDDDQDGGNDCAPAIADDAGVGAGAEDGAGGAPDAPDATPDKWWTRDGSPDDPHRFRVRPPMSIEASKLVDLMLAGTPGDILSDAELTQACGKATAPGSPGYSPLRTATKFCEVAGVVWRRTYKAGEIKCLPAVEIVSTSGNDLKHVYRTTRRIGRRIGSVNVSELDEPHRRECRALCAQATTLAMFSASRTTKKFIARKIEKAVDMKRLLENW